VENPGQGRQTSQDDQHHALPNDASKNEAGRSKSGSKHKPTLPNRFFVFRKKVERQDRRKEGTQLPADD
jgi:hypothetical protein